MGTEARTVGSTLNDENVNSALGRRLLVMEHDALTRYALPLAHSLQIGRAETCEIVLRDPMASRLHAKLHVGDLLELEDLGSHNGTRVRHERLTPHERVRVRTGDTIQIGNAILIVQAVRNDAVGKRPSEGPFGPGIVLRDPAMHEVHELVKRVATGNINVLVIGETGAGKEVVAEAIHRQSGLRSAGPFVRINCAAVTEQLFESELFGHERGSFTGATRAKQGLLEAADKGTVFLDEVGELPLTVQAKLLRALESREITRVGGLKPRAIDVRFVAATNRDLRAEVARGRFREDLFFRLTGVTISVPPLRERPAEIEPLVHAFVSSISADLERALPRVDAEALTKLNAYGWPGNIRELRNAMECAVLRCDGVTIQVSDLPAEVVHRTQQPQAPTDWNTTTATVSQTVPALPIVTISKDGVAPTQLKPEQQVERQRIVEALATCNGNQTRAAEYLQMPRRTLVAKLVAYDIPRPRKPTQAPGS